ncbi:ras association domain-containing protein 1-like isoform X1 [Anneissia japonica]|uniref:ras association domain-containing protein 1-like isoform X1 n=1 Tax=Anneissia japonica TaxID=1529436 RepID=UPI001425848C|nr:ras association domain-containing protein 1-like isoform X1 [Anneissia japonica]XP_033120041.1 ras association domain-containing protein 1-like isoform X1 [Anneissia japonica]
MSTLHDIWTKMTEYIEMRTLERENGISHPNDDEILDAASGNGGLLGSMGLFFGWRQKLMLKSDSDKSKPKHKKKNGVSKEMDSGHDFVPIRLMTNPTWCDKCGAFIWGFYAQSLKCKHCNYTCHYKCVKDVRLGCKKTQEFKDQYEEETDSGVADLGPTTVVPSKIPVGPCSQSLTRSQLKDRIDHYNSNADGTAITLESDGCSFVGSVRVRLNLSRPISVPTDSHMAHCHGAQEQYDHCEDTTRARTSFFLPKNTVKALHITSETTAQEVIMLLLNKFKVIDNPQKFALFEKNDENGNSCIRRLGDQECPLFLCLSWGGDNGRKRFLLQENETGQILVS